MTDKTKNRSQFWEHLACRFKWAVSYYHWIFQQCECCNTLSCGCLTPLNTRCSLQGEMTCMYFPQVSSVLLVIWFVRFLFFVNLWEGLVSPFYDAQKRFRWPFIFKDEICICTERTWKDMRVFSTEMASTPINSTYSYHNSIHSPDPNGESDGNTCMRLSRSLDYISQC